MNRINSSYIFLILNLSLYQFIKASGRHKYVSAHCMVELGDLKNFKVQKKHSHFFLNTILTCRLPTGFWVPQMVMLHKLHTSFRFFSDVERLNKKKIKKKLRIISRFFIGLVSNAYDDCCLAIVNPIQFQLCRVTDF